MKTLFIGALQIPTLGMNTTRLEFYLKNARERGAKLLLFGEYVLNHFFRELEKMPRSMVKEQSKKHIKLLRKMSEKYSMAFVAPIIVIKQKNYYKTIAYITPKKVRYYYQQILIPYRHWNEKTFFSNDTSAPLSDPMIFKLNGFRIAVMSGFELHFDKLWENLGRRNVDLVLLPTASTFGSHNRWRELIKSRAFLHGCYILRANRLGEYADRENQWRFYGDSMLVNPEGEVEMMLEDKESMLIEPISKAVVQEHRKTWLFEKMLAERETE